MNLTIIRTWAVFLSYLVSSYAFSAEVNYLVTEDITKPFQITHNNVSEGGIVSDIVGEIFNGSEYTVKTHILPLNRLYKMVETGELKNWVAYDAKVWNALSQWGDFVEEPLFPVTHAYLTCRKDAPKEIKSPNDISNHNIAIIKNFDYPELSQLNQNKQLNLTAVDGYSQGINLTSLNRVDGFVEMELRLRYNINRASLNQPCLQFVDISNIIPAYSIYLSTDKNNQSGINRFTEKRIRALKKAGVITKIMNRYTKAKAEIIANGTDKESL